MGLKLRLKLEAFAANSAGVGPVGSKGVARLMTEEIGLVGKHLATVGVDADVGLAVNVTFVLVKSPFCVKLHATFFKGALEFLRLLKKKLISCRLPILFISVIACHLPKFPFELFMPFTYLSFQSLIAVYF